MNSSGSDGEINEIKVERSDDSDDCGGHYKTLKLNGFKSADSWHNSAHNIHHNSERENEMLSTSKMMGYMTLEDVMAKDERNANTLLGKLQTKTMRSIRDEKVKNANALQSPPNNFRGIPNYPTCDDIHVTEKPFLRRNIVRGKYNSVDHYLDIHFRLLREDFMRPLREGIKDYLKGVQNSGIRVYNNVVITGPKRYYRNGDYMKAYEAVFDDKSLVTVNWDDNKWLLYGSLVCFSYDNFNTFCCASVVVGDRDAKELSKGRFWLKFIVKDKHRKRFISKKLVMIESQAYYEAYRYNLLALKQISRQTFPLKDYLIDVSTNIKLLAHLSHSTRYDLSFTKLSIDLAKNEESKDINADLNSLVKVVSNDLWPKPHELCFDDSQYEAYKAGLTKQLALIQGPPGTGKTYVGLRIVQTLLRNKHLWNKLNNNNTRLSPILVVCYTNHALDQFLEGMLPFCKDEHKMVRFGGQSKSVLLKPFNYMYLKEIRNFNIRKYVRECDIIGMTTTGAAKRRYLLEPIDPYIVIVEEAAEVLESHVVTALTRSTKHLILIGDHQQLRPNLSVYELAKKYSLDISMFERMIMNGMPYCQLNFQHRMRPEISALLVPHIYKHLKDHESVKDYPNIKGVGKNVYFLNHNQTEIEFNDTKSKMNHFEAEFIVCLCKYLVQQNYSPSQITILCMYSAQLTQVKSCMKKHETFLKDVRASVLDGYQGEESDIVLLSFVRSNSERNIGFLKVSNRVNVALSRAKMGMYCIGNFDLLAEQSELWKDIIKDLKASQSIGSSLPLYCQNHTDYKISVSKASHFDQFPDGGCGKPCNYKLQCGHVCTQKCHVLDVEHINFRCLKVFTKILPCGHNKTAKCYQNPTEIYCPKRCEKTLSCGHKCNRKCGDECDPKRCQSIIDILSVCGHQIKIHCGKQLDIDIQLNSCKQKCDTILECGHRCGGNCHDCHQKRLHIKCKEKCERRLICGHTCSSPCFMQCPPCVEKCQIICAHRKCCASCGQECTPCLKRCVRRCDHKRCSRLCHEPCDYCLEPCTKTIKCKHRCIGLCGERCPNKCRICDKELFIGEVDKANARFIQLIDCGHVIEVNAMIEWLSMSENQNVSQNQIGVKKCPKCKTNIIRKTEFLNALMRDFNNDIKKVKQSLSGNQNENRKLEKELETKIKTLNRNYFQQNSQTPNTLNGLVCKILKNISTQLKPSQRTSAKPKYALIEFENKIEMISEVIELNKTIENAKKLLFISRFAPLDTLLDQFRRRIMIFIQCIDSIFVNNTQQILDAKNELKYLFTVNSVINSLSNHYLLNEDFRNILIEVFDILNQLTPFTEEKKDNIKSLIEKALKLVGKFDFNFETNTTILKALSFRAGYWLKCDNNHVYCVTECGVGENESCLQCRPNY